MKDGHAIYVEEMIAKTKALVEATDFERLCLWREYTDRDGHEQNWKQESFGHSEVIAYVGWLEKRPITVSLFWSWVGGRLICFWEAVSEIVDFAIVKEWLRDKFPHVKNTGNAMNFHNALRAEYD